MVIMNPICSTHEGNGLIFLGNGNHANDRNSAQENNMSIRNLILSVSTALLLSGAAYASELRPIQGYTLDLGEVLGVAYYTVEQDGYHVVATLAEGKTGAPVRFEATLSSGQAVTFSSPVEQDGALMSVEFRRLQEQVVVRTTTVTN
jgi:hypothetical protein